jgi:hypothetical protein
MAPNAASTCYGIVTVGGDAAMPAASVPFRGETCLNMCSDGERNSGDDLRRRQRHELRETRATHPGRPFHLGKRS